MEAYRVNIQGLSTKIHHFEFDLGDAFFRKFDAGLVSAGNLSAKVSLDKRETFIEGHFEISGCIKLVCDRSLDTFDYPVRTDHRIVFKFGQEDAEISEDVLMIHYNTESLELGQLMFEFIELAVPMKKLHPRFKQSDKDDDEIVYSSDSEPEKDETDPRWEKLKNLNKNK